MTEVKRLPAHHVSELFVLQKVEFFADVHLWPERQILDPRGWLDNFTAAERPLAVHVLNVFLYFSESLVNALLRAALQSLSSEIVATATSLSDAKSAWRAFLSSLTVSYVHGEQPQATDSGHIFARKARQVLEIAERQILEPSEAIGWLADRSEGTLLLVDDFVGSGRQMTSTWTRTYTSAAGKRGTFRSLHQNGIRVIYVPLVATTYGIAALQTACRGLELRAAHVFDTRYSLTHGDSILWPESLKSTGRDFLFSASKRAGIVDNGKHGWEGFHALALALAFWHSVPDATLPLLYWDQSGWSPLIRRT